jgi:hypothetical protein
MLGPTRNEVTGENCILYTRRMRWTGHVAHIGEMKKCAQNLSETLKGRDHFKDILENNIKMDLEEIWFEESDWIYLAHCCVVANTGIKLWVSGQRNFFTS